MRAAFYNPDRAVEYLLNVRDDVNRPFTISAWLIFLGYSRKRTARTVGWRKWEASAGSHKHSCCTAGCRKRACGYGSLCRHQRSTDQSFRSCSSSKSCYRWRWPCWPPTILSGRRPSSRRSWGRRNWSWSRGRGNREPRFPPQQPAVPAVALDRPDPAPHARTDPSTGQRRQSKSGATDRAAPGAIPAVAERGCRQRRATSAGSAGDQRDGGRASRDRKSKGIHFPFFLFRCALVAGTV